MQVSEITFCKSIGYNLKNDREKSDILDKLLNDYNVNFDDNNLIYSDKILKFILNYEHFVTTITNGNKYWLYLTKFKNTNYSILIDKKIQKGHRFPKMIIVNYRFKDELYNDTLFKCELIRDKKNNWKLIIDDIDVYKGKNIMRKNYIDKIKLIYSILDKKYINDDLLEVCSICVKKIFTYEQLDHMIDNFIENCKYKIIGLSFIPIVSRKKSIVFMFRKLNNEDNHMNIKLLNSNNSLKESKESVKTLLNKNKFIIENLNMDNSDLSLLNMLNNESYEEYCDDKIVTFIIKKSKFPNIFPLYIKNGPEYIKQSIARIDTIECAEMVNNLLNINSGDVFVDCLYCIKFNKWIPLNQSKSRNTCTLLYLENYFKNNYSNISKR